MQKSMGSVIMILALAPITSPAHLGKERKISNFINSARMIANTAL